MLENSGLLQNIWIKLMKDKKKYCIDWHAGGGEKHGGGVAGQKNGV